MLDVSGIVTGKLRLNVRLVELSSLIGAAVDAVRPAADSKGIQLQTVLDPRAGPVSGDPDRLQQESALECGEVHTQRRASASPARAHQLAGGDCGERYL